MIIIVNVSYNVVMISNGSRCMITVNSDLFLNCIKVLVSAHEEIIIECYIVTFVYVGVNIILVTIQISLIGT